MWIEDLAVQKAMDILYDEAVIDYLVDRIFDLQGEENPRLPRLRLQLEDVENRIKNIIAAIEQGIIFDSTKDRLAKLEKEKNQLDLTIVQEQIKKPFLTKEQIRFGIEKFKKLDISTKEGKQRLIDDLSMRYISMTTRLPLPSTIRTEPKQYSFRNLTAPRPVRI